MAFAFRPRHCGRALVRRCVLPDKLIRYAGPNLKVLPGTNCRNVLARFPAPTKAYYLLETWKELICSHPVNIAVSVLPSPLKFISRPIRFLFLSTLLIFDFFFSRLSVCLSIFLSHSLHFSLYVFVHV